MLLVQFEFSWFWRWCGGVLGGGVGGEWGVFWSGVDGARC